MAVDPTHASPPVPILDGHNDSIILRQVRDDPMDFMDVNPRYHVDMPRLRALGIHAMMVMVGDNDMLQSLTLIDAIHRMCDAHPREFALCLNADDVRGAERDDKMGLIMSIEGQSMFAERMENLRNWHRLGVRVASLTHGAGRIGGSPHALQYDGSAFGYFPPNIRDRVRRRTKGLTDFGREALDEMARLGIVCDLAHANDVAFWETLEHGQVPVCVTHGNCYALCQHMRNCTDEMLRALAQRGGVIGICFFGGFVDAQRPNVGRLADHFLHALEIMGPDHVGVGSDFDGIAPTRELVVKTAADMELLWAELSRRGVPEPVLKKIGMANFLRLLGPAQK